MKVSIIIPVYKVEDYIERCISSVIAQTYQQLEVILVDDCGGDASIEKAQQLLGKSALDWKVVTHEKNKGLSAARNSGVREATGDFIFFLDSDDSLTHDAIEHLVSMQQTHNVDVVVGSYVRIDAAGNELPSLRKRIDQGFVPTTPITSLVNGDMPVVAWAKLIKRQFYIDHKIQFVEGMLYEDEPWSVWLFLKSNKVYLSEKVIYNYSARDGSITSQQEVSILAVKSRLKSIELIRIHMLQNKIEISSINRKWLFGLMYRGLWFTSLCRQLDRKSKLKIYKNIFEQYSFLWRKELMEGLLMRMAYSLSLFFPLYIAFHISTSVRKFIYSIKI